MASPSAATPYETKRDEVIQFLRSKAGSYSKADLEKRIETILKEKSPTQANTQLAVLANRIGKSMATPLQTKKLNEDVQPMLAELGTLATAATSPGDAAKDAKTATVAVKAPDAKPSATKPCPVHDPPLGFKDKAQYDQCMSELRQALDSSGIKYTKVGARGSAVLGHSPTKGTKFDEVKKSDIDVFFVLAQGEADRLRLTPSQEIPGFIHPNKIMQKSEALRQWAEKWEKQLGREISPGGFISGGKLDEASKGTRYIIHKPPAPPAVKT
jgi:hypothetical protein